MSFCRSQIFSAAACLAALAATACATSGNQPLTETAAPGSALEPSRIPPPPASASSGVAAAWERLRGDSAEAALASLALLPDGEAESAEGITARGFALLSSGNLAAAQDAFGRAVGSQPLLAEAAYGMALIAQARGDAPLARRWLDAAMDADPALARADVARRSLDLVVVEDELIAAERAAESGDLVAALDGYRRAISLSPLTAGTYASAARIAAATGDSEGAIELLRRGLQTSGENRVLLEPLAELLGDTGRLAEAADAYQRLVDLMPSDPRALALARAARDRYEAESLPIEYRELAQRAAISREELAAILAINLTDLEGRVDPIEGVVVSDSVDRWSSQYVQRMVRWGVLDVYQNDFMPEMMVRRSMLVEACYRVLELIGAAAGAPRPRLHDPPPQHMLYRPVQTVVGLGLMEADREGWFDLLAPVTGAEALHTVERLAALVRRSGT